MATTSRPTVPLRDKLLLTLPETCALLSISEMTLRRLIGNGQLNVVRLGRAVRVKRTDLEEYVRGIEPDGQIQELPDWIQELAFEGRRR